MTHHTIHDYSVRRDLTGEDSESKLGDFFLVVFCHHVGQKNIFRFQNQTILTDS